MGPGSAPVGSVTRLQLEPPLVVSIIAERPSSTKHALEVGHETLGELLAVKPVAGVCDVQVTPLLVVTSMTAAVPVEFSPTTQQSVAVGHEIPDHRYEPTGGPVAPTTGVPE
jgi:hypothetical protein